MTLFLISKISHVPWGIVGYHYTDLSLFLGITDWMLLPSLRSLIGAQSDIEASSPKDFFSYDYINIWASILSQYPMITNDEKTMKQS